jgi:hypothetical protein
MHFILTGLMRWPAFEADSACGSMVLYDHLCSVFPRGARKNRTPTEIRYRSAEGKNADRVTPVIPRKEQRARDIPSPAA